MTASIKKVKDAGKWVTVVDRALSQPGIEDLYVAGDNPGLGATTADYFKKALPNGGNIVVLRGLPIPIDKQRVDAFMDGIKDTNIKVLDSQFANWNRDDGYKVMQDFLTKYPKIDAVWAQDDDTLVGALKAIKEAGRDKEMWAVGGAGMNQIVKMVAAGDPSVPVDVSYNPNMVATAIDLTALHFAAGAQVDGTLHHQLDADHQGQRARVRLPEHAVLIVRQPMHGPSGRSGGLFCSPGGHVSGGTASNGNAAPCGRGNNGEAECSEQCFWPCWPRWP